MNSKESEPRMKLVAMVAAATVVSSLMFGCSRARQDAVLLANEADKARKSGDKDGAIQKLTEATNLDRANHRIWYKLSQVHRDKEDWAKMAEAAQGAIKAEEEVGKGKVTYATYYAERGYALEKQAEKKTLSYEEAKGPYTKCIEIDPHYAACYNRLGNVYLWLDDEQKALEFYSKAIEHNPDELDFYPPLVDLYLTLGFPKEAESLLNEAKSRGKAGEKGLFNIHVLSARLLQERGDVAGAAKELETARDISKKMEESAEAVLILYNLGSVYAELARTQGEKKQQGIEMLKGFYARACKNPAKAKLYALECATAKEQVSSLGGTLQ